MTNFDKKFFTRGFASVFLVCRYTAMKTLYIVLFLI